MIAAFYWLVWLLYAVAGFFYLRDFLYKHPNDRRTAQQMIIAAIGTHLLLLLVSVYHLHRLPVATVSEALSTFVWMTALIYWLLERAMVMRRVADRSMGTLILPVLLCLLLISILTYRPDEQVAGVLKDVRFEFHVLTLLVAYGAFAISFIASLLHTLLDREIRKRTVRVFYSRLPSLAFFEKISNTAIDIGLVFATVGYATGFYSAMQVWNSFLLSDPKFISALLPWFVYCIHFLGRRFVGWSGQFAATLSLVGFTLILFSFIVISLLFTRLHRFV